MDATEADNKNKQIILIAAGLLTSQVVPWDDGRLAYARTRLELKLPAAGGIACESSLSRDQEFTVQ